MGETFIEDLTDRKFHNWTVIGFAGHISYGRYRYEMWTCQCQCGKRVNVIRGNLTQGLSTKCRACQYKSMRTRLRGPHFHVWKQHRKEMCPEWDHPNKFKAFYDNRDGRNLRRYDESKPYSPENCFWSDTNERGDSFREQIVAKRMSLLGETRLTAEAWVRRVTRQRQHQWWEKFKEATQVGVRKPVQCKHNRARKGCRECDAERRERCRLSSLKRDRARRGVPLDAPLSGCGRKRKGA